MPQPQPRQQSRLNDIQMLQRHIMVKQLQELQRQQQFQELGDARQQNYLNQQPMINRQVSGDQFPPLIHGTPIHDASQRFMVGNMNFLHHGSSSVQGISHGMSFPQAQSQALLSTGMLSPQHDASLYGTPVASAGNNMGPYSHLLGESRESNMHAKGNDDQTEKPVMPSSAFSNHLRSNPCDDSSNQICLQGGALESRQELQEKNLFAQVRTQGLSSDVLAGNFQQVNTLQRRTSSTELGAGQEQTGWPGLFSEKTENNGPSQGLCSLDPLEQKILFNMDDNWETSFERGSTISTGGFGNTTENTDHTNSFPLVQSGSWSALMQSAVAEAPSSDTGVQEWTDLSFQNREVSTDDHHSNFTDSGKAHSNWVDNSIKNSTSLSQKSEFQLNSSNMSSNFPGSKQSGVQFSMKQKQGIFLESSSECDKLSPRNNNKLDFHPLQKQIIEQSQQVQRLSPLQSAWPGQNYENTENNAHHQNTSTYTTRIQTGDILEAAYVESHSLRNTDDRVLGSFSNSVGGLEHVKSGHGNTNRQVQDGHQLGYMRGTNVSVDNEGNENTRSKQHHQSNIPQIGNNTYTRIGGYEKQECFLSENSTDSYHSNASQHTVTGNDLRNNLWQHKSDSRNTSEVNQMPSVQVPLHQKLQGLNSHELEYAERFKFSGNVSSSGMDFDKQGDLPVQKNSTKGVPPTTNIGSNISGFFDGASSIDSPNGAAQTSQNMLDLMHKVDNSNQYQLGMHFPEAPQVENLYPSASQSYDKRSHLQGFGLRLSPPSDHISKSSPQTGNSSGPVPLGFSHVRNQFQKPQHQAVPVGRQSHEATVPYLGSNQDTSHLISPNPYGQQPSLLEANPVTQAFVTSGISQEAGFSMRRPNIWTNVPTQLNQFGRQPDKNSVSLLPSPESTSSGLRTASTAPYFAGGNETGTNSMKLEDFKSQEEQAMKETPSQHISYGIFDSVSQKGKLSFEQESVKKASLDMNELESGSLMTNYQQQGFSRAHDSDDQSRKTPDLEVFGRSLKPSYIPSQQYSLLHQMHSLRNVQNDPSKRVLAKHSGVDSDLNIQQATADAGKKLYEDTSRVQNVVNDEMKSMLQVQVDLLQSAEGNRQQFSSETRENQKANVLSKPILRDTNQETTGPNGSECVSHATGQSPTSFQVAASWFKHGNLKNGQMLPMYDPRAAHQFSPGKLLMNSSTVPASSFGTAQEGSFWPTTANTSVAIKHSSPLFVLPDVIAQDPAVLRPKKRKFAASELLPWHKEVTQESQRLLDSSSSDLEWAQAANQLIEKVNDEVATMEDAPILRSKKRLTLTTQLMQRVFRPAPGAILRGDAASDYDTVAYFTARFSLGDACSWSSSSHASCDKTYTPSEIPKTFEIFGRQGYAELVEGFINRAEKLEADFLSFDKSTSIPDLKVESQELEKFSIINRFAKFHSRGGQVRTTETSASSSTRVFPQRYVTAIPMPRTIPEGAQCLPI